MSGHDMEPYRKQFDAACAALGWAQRNIVVEHERDYGCSWQEECWYSAQGDFLFKESRVSEGFVKEVIRLGARSNQSIGEQCKKGG